MNVNFIQLSEFNFAHGQPTCKALYSAFQVACQRGTAKQWCIYQYCVNHIELCKPHSDRYLGHYKTWTVDYRRLQNVCHREAKSWFRLLTDCGQSYYREQWDHPYKEGSSLFRFHFSVANILQSPVWTGLWTGPWTGLFSMN